MTIRRAVVLGLLIVGFGAPGLAAQAHVGATGKCKDGSYTTAKTRSDACSEHGGVVEWKGPPAQPATAPAGATGKCKDGTYTTVKTRSSACSKHGGVAKWMGAPAATAEPGPGATPGASAMTNPAPAPPEHPEPPAGATAQCKDGTYSTSKRVADTCSKHGGVGKWIHKPAS